MSQLNNNISQYEDMLTLPHPVSRKHPQMSMIDRAAQFFPFAALTGYDGQIKETARLTNQRIELDETAKAIIDEKLRLIHENLSSESEVEITYFKPDEKKEGGAYLTVSGVVKKINGYERMVLMTDQTLIPMEEIVSINGELFGGMEEE